MAQRVLDGVDLAVSPGRFVAIMGPSGSGKSTLLHLLGGLDTPTAGDVHVDGVPLSDLSDRERTLLRRDRIGIVYQFFNLVPVLTAAENIALPAVISGIAPKTYGPRVDEVIDLVGLDGERDKLPNQLSGGQQQRAAIGRALLSEPSIILADEPTGNLDLRTGFGVLALLVAAQQDLGQTVVMVTHDPLIAAHADEVHLLRDGAFAADLTVSEQVSSEAAADPTHESRGRAVLEWLQELGAAGPARSAVH
ncbi:MAG: ABC transporter ATP-binding protein [Actinobacteria bacterium]|nr:ABC transporter ATP-binding protein [Actinomycetota bacterium]